MKITQIAAVAMNRIKVSRVISKGVPPKKIACGKNSAIDGPWKVEAADRARAAGCSRKAGK